MGRAGRWGRCAVLGALLTTPVGGLLAQPPQAPSAGPVRVGQLGAVDDYLSRSAEFGFRGAIVVEADGARYARGYGRLYGSTGPAIGPDTPFVVGSISKTFTATLVLRLAAWGVLSLHDPVSRFFPEASGGVAGVTVDHLLRHTSGLPFHTHANPSATAPRPDVYREMLSLALESTPGTEVSYSSPAYVLLAGIVERAVGEPYEIVLKREVLDPLGMHDTGSIFEPQQWEPVAGPPPGADAFQSPVAFVGMSKAVGSGSVVSTASDLARWADAVGDPRLLPPAWWDSAFVGGEAAEGVRFTRSGWRQVTTTRGTRVLLHAGDFGPFNGEVRVYPDEGRTIAFLSNTRVRGRGYREAVMNPVATIAAGGSVALPPRVGPWPSASAWIPTARPARFEATHGGLSFRRSGDRLGVSLRGDARNGFSTSVADSAATLSDRAGEIFIALSAGLITVLESVAHPAMPWQGLVEQERRFWADAPWSQGAEVHPDVTIAVGGGVYVTAVDLHAEGSRVRRWIEWESDRVLGLELPRPFGEEWAFRPSAEAGFVWHDPFSGRTVRLHLEQGRATLRPEDGSASWTFQRVSRR